MQLFRADPELTESRPPIEETKRRSGVWIAVAIVLTCLLWGLALPLPVWETRSNQSGAWSVCPGVLPALIGFLGLLVKCPAWFANLLLIPLCIMLIRGWRGGFLVSLVALGLAASAYMFPAIYGDNDEAVIMRRLIGFYFWLGSFVTMALAHVFLTITEQRIRTVARVATVTLIVLVIGVLELTCRVGTSPLETSLKTPDDLTQFNAALARNPPQAEKDSALSWAVRQDRSTAQRLPSKRIAMLLAAGANPNKSERYSSTLLMQVLPPYGSQAFVELLVKAGADVNARDYRGKTVLDIAQEIGSSAECQKFLSDAGARSGGQTNN